MKKILSLLAVLTVFALCASSCATTEGVKRIDSNTQTDLSGYWNDTDVRIVCRALIESCISSARIDQVRSAKRRTPTVVIGKFSNDSSEHIDTEIITTNMRVAIINSGKLDFVAGGATLDAIRAEKMDQLMYANEETAASLANEVGADFMLVGSVKTIVDRAGNQTVRTYVVSADLVDVESRKIIWTEQNSDIKKSIVRAKNKL